MSQHDMNIANQGFPAFRSDLNDALAALVSTSSGATAPTTTFANQLWYDTANDKLKIRNEANSGWIEIVSINQSTGVLTTIAGTVIDTPTITGAATFAAGTVSAPSITTTGDTNTGVFFPAADTVAVTTSGTERMRIGSSGNIGIGTTTPSQLFDVKGIQQFTNSTTPANFSYIYDGGGLLLSSNNSNPMYFYTGASERLRIDNAGNLGIGTSTPPASLSIVKQSTVLSGTSNPYGVHIYPVSSGVSYIDAITNSTSNSSLSFRTYNNGTYNEMRMDSSGNVGIGTSSITTAGGRGLQVFSSSSASNVRVTYTGFTGVDLIQGSDGSGYVWNRDNQALLFGTNNAECARIDTSGNLLVGASSNTWAGSYLASSSSLTLTSGSSVNLSSSICGSAIVCVYVNGSGNGGVFFLNYSATAVKLAGDGAATDTGTDFAVYKSAGSHTSTLKNKSASTQTFTVIVLAGKLT